jgi:hypothetical protein
MPDRTSADNSEIAITGTLGICHETTSLSRDERGKSEAEELTWLSLLTR